MANQYDTPKCDPAKRDPDVNIAASRLDQSLDRLTETVERAENRLVPVLGHESPQTAGSATVATPGNCAVSIAMYGASERVDYATRRLRDLLDRLEI